MLPTDIYGRGRDGTDGVFLIFLFFVDVVIWMVRFWYVLFLLLV